MAGQGHWALQQYMLQRVADALGPELLREVAFVGGCTTGMLITDDVSREAVRYTDDVDLIVHVLGLGNWYQLQRVLAEKGFRTTAEDDVICRTRLRDGGAGELIVDFMPDDAAVLGFGNRWYADALREAVDHALPSGTVVRVVGPAYFLGTKLEAYRGRGNRDPLASRDVEDILNVVDGRASLGDEVAQAPEALRADIAGGIAELLRHRDFDYAVQATARNNREREALLFTRLEALAAHGR
ncbi:hypothetical protein [Luteimonas sp. FCS-9]|uniref:hypothetical protein n=1 Tax=Luteimonas sp. FCS-9 TaxID=1547516 RepID=UPI00063EB266|nr:hypothetical protein [Luteimonas sp. FCS-9]KLI97852.1 hypothetical protein WQ56_16270 [Luteimonas sp. FCS-9]